MTFGHTDIPLRALIVGDSLGSPRPHRGQKLDVTWPVLLKKAFREVDIWQRCRAGSMSNEVLKEYNLFSDSIDAFQLLIIQVGIGDCCPRPYPLWMEQFLATYGFKGMRKCLNALYPFLLNFRARQWISREQFIRNIRFMIDTTRARNPNAAIAVVRIGTPCRELVKRIKDAPPHAASYNAALERLCASYGPDSDVTCIDPYRDHEPEELFIADGHHLTQVGHLAVAQALEPFVRRLADRAPRDSERCPSVFTGAFTS